ncbi:hypothetical protein S1OALGB6SA_17 [Olavius algarvensis spirochete endosymbiont]|nr:hypothetical protein S1OALGB6SA_17 [Olavius algarvensis spirochete endosymbiont]
MRRRADIKADIETWVSIHAPARGATGFLGFSRRFLMFQSTHPRGVRRQAIWRVWQLGGFNPRTREGCDD